MELEGDSLQWENIKHILLSQYSGLEIAKLQQHSCPRDA